ncbi:SoxR reducing system RseC family protein [Otariodibacter oris]|uniref:RseC/MucC-like positive regulator of sigma(E) n=1 Tax=Otariodibacter oris TaxID=1032623 RepID=A0A420XJ62_9PAST|nr:SoxR reducing system RseC family protein [Otariodibacter oris]QGM80457.1 transcriptional regulator [Otariodibacter oris]RKR77397.1 RseC/MucC-like positive regulator of sigma(E) [Otariodibacter oris]
MMVEYATVVNYSKGIATVVCDPKVGCGSCVSSGACGTRTLSALAGEKSALEFELKVSETLSIGDKIEIGLTERNLLLGVFGMYGIPLIVFIGSALLFSQWIDNELVVALIMFMSTAGLFAGMKKVLQKKSMGQFIPVFLRKI